VIVLWAALIVALTAAAYSVTWDLCNAGNDEPVAMATPLLAEDHLPPQPAAVKKPWTTAARTMESTREQSRFRKRKTRTWLLTWHNTAPHDRTG
jgi:hypothetical protein